jgi:RNA polymerase-binding protein DksA
MSTDLTAGQQAQLRGALEARRDQLKRQLAEHLHGISRTERMHEVAQQDADDEPQRRPEREVAMALTDHERRELEAVKAALQRIEQGRYGRCVDCEVSIPFDRLRAEPWAMRCIDCENRHERAAPRGPGCPARGLAVDGTPAVASPRSTHREGGGADRGAPDRPVRRAVSGPERSVAARIRAGPGAPIGHHPVFAFSFRMLHRLRRLLPTPDAVHAHRGLRWLGPALGHPRLWRWRRRGIALGVALGLFWGLLVPVAQIPLSAGAAVLLRANLPCAIAATLVTNPLTFGPVYFAAWKVGGVVLGHSGPPPAALTAADGVAPRALDGDGARDTWRSRAARVGKPLAVGLGLFAIVGAAASYLLVSAACVARTRWRWRTRRARRQGQAARTRPDD